MNPAQNWSTVKDALKLTPARGHGKHVSGGTPDLLTFSATCYYFGESSHWRDCHSAAPTSPFSRCNNMDGEGGSVK